MSARARTRDPDAEYTSPGLAEDNQSMPSDMDQPPAPLSAEPESDDAFEALVWAAVDSLPEVFRDRLGTVAIVVEEDATPEELARVGAPGLLGLYTGVPRTRYGASEAALPSKITIYRGPHMRIFRTPESLARGVAETVRHEIAHHFGISDARLEELARERRS
jgi:predicted Zn-dependent protease with MMP-like domain